MNENALDTARDMIALGHTERAVKDEVISVLIENAGIDGISEALYENKALSAAVLSAVIRTLTTPSYEQTYYNAGKVLHDVIRQAYAKEAQAIYDAALPKERNESRLNRRLFDAEEARYINNAVGF